MNLREFITVLTTILVLQGTSIAGADDYYPFNARFGAPLADLIEYPECPIESRECRRWGIAAAIPVNHRPGASIDSDDVEMLYRGGMNYIRFNDVDVRRNRIFDAWREGRIVDANQGMQLLDMLIPQLRAKNMQYALSANDQARKAEHVGAPDNEFQRDFKFAQMTHEPAIIQARDWMRWVFSRPVVGAGTVYGHDPANRYVALLGEDSIYYGMFSAWGQQFDPGTRQQLLDCYASRTGVPLQNIPDRRVLRNDSSVAESISFCLDYLERRYYEALLSAELRAVLPDQIATSNGWYGLGYIRNTARIGSVIDMNFYFDHRILIEGDGNVGEAVRNRSVISQPGLREHRDRNMLRSSLMDFFAGSIEGLPLHISEWNHSAWSDYAYEGALLVLAYASLQDVPVISLHQLYHFTDDKSIESTRSGFSAHGNQMFQAMNPTLALAYRRGDITRSSAQGVFSLKGESSTFHEEEFRAAREAVSLSTDVAQGLKRRFRFSADGSGDILPPVDPSGPVEFPVRSDTGEIHWLLESDAEGVFSIDAPRFRAVAGSLSRVDSDRKLQVTADGHGAVLAISLDDRALGSSERILVTLVSSQRQPHENIQMVSHQWYGYPLKLVKNVGVGSVELKRLMASVKFFDMQHAAYRLSSIDENGNVRMVAVVEPENNLLSLTLGQHDSPWYLLERAIRPDPPRALRRE